MGKIFISYRRADTQGWAGRLGDEFARTFGDAALFFDIERIAEGDDIRETIGRALEDVEVMVVLIGPHWLSATLPDGRHRLDQPDDFVVIEIATALARAIRVIPILVGGATMPRAEQLPATISLFAGRLAFELSDTRWDFDCNRLADGIQSRTSLRRHPNPDAANAAVVRVAEGLFLAGVEAGDIIGVQGDGGALGKSLTVEVAKDARISNSKIGDIIGARLESPQKK